MTAEIAILNRSAVALAADSVLTLVGPEFDKKTFDSAEKIFELSRYQPLGLMIYNNATFMNIPLELLIRRFRETLTAGAFRALTQVRPEFERFLLGLKQSEADRMEHFRLMLNSEIAAISSTVLNEKLKALLAGKKKRLASLRILAERVIDERTLEVKQKPIEDSSFMQNISLDEFLKHFNDEIRNATETGLKTTLEDVAESVFDKVATLMFWLLKSQTRSPAYTGLVFAGLGSDDLFPTLDAVELDGVYFNQLRTFKTDPIDIDREGPTSAIVPFAQTDMAERFIHGIDKSFEKGLETIVSDLSRTIVDRAGVDLPDNGQAIIEDALASFRLSIGDLKSSAERKLNSIVNHMSRKELAELAHSLVELTSRKRRYSTDAETVGGPIDVAVLTRNEGFIWVRRKHYFDLELNPRFRMPRVQY